MSALLNSLQEFVTPKALEATQGYEGTEQSKKSALEAIYTLFVHRLTDTQVVNRVDAPDAAHQDHGLLGLALGQTEHGLFDKIFEAIAQQFNLPSATVSALSSVALPLTLSHLKSQAGAMPLATYVSDQKDGLTASLPTWLTAVLPAGLFGASAAIPTNPLLDTDHVATKEPVVKETVVEQGVLTKEEKPEGSMMKGLLPIIGALILAALGWALLKGCQKEPTPVAAPAPVAQVESAAPAAALTPASLTLGLNETGQAVFSCRSVVGDDSLSTQVKSAVATAFGGENCQFDINGATDTQMPAAEFLPKIFEVMKGVPDASVSIVGKTIRLNSSNADALQKLVTDIKAIVPADFTVEAEPVLNVEEAVKNSIVAANEAIDHLGQTSTIEDLLRALNLQIINFAVDSAEIPAENKAILDKAVKRIKELPEAKLLITGHTDNQGTHEYNQALSERRAKAVHDYLVAQGVDDAKLELKGASYDNPVATNATEQGRFANRRIEFTLFHDGELVGAAGDTAVATPLANEAQAVMSATQEAAANTAEAAKGVVAGAAEATKEAVTNK